MGVCGLHGVDAAAGNFDNHIADIVDNVGVVVRAADHAVGPDAAVQCVLARAAIQRVVAIEPGQQVGTRVAGDDVGQGIAGARDATDAQQRQIFQVRAQCPGHGALHQIGSGTDIVDDDVGGHVDDVGVIADPADHRVIAGSAVQRVIVSAAEQRVIARHARQPVCAAVAGQGIGPGVAGAVDGRRAGQGQILDVQRQRVRDRGLDPVEPAGRGFDHAVAAVIDDVEIGTAATGHRIAAGTAVQRVVAQAPVQRVDAAKARQDVRAGVAGDGVALGRAGAVDVGGPGQGQVLDLRGQGVAAHGQHRVGAAFEDLDHHVARIVDDVSVIVPAADHAVGPDAAIQRIGPVTAKKRVVAVKAGQQVAARVAGDDVGQRVAGTRDPAGSGQCQVFKVRPQRPGHDGLDGVGPFPQTLDDDVGHQIDDEGVIAGAANQRIGAGAAIQRVVPAAAVQCVVAIAVFDQVRRTIAGQGVVAGVAGAVDCRRPGQDQAFDVGSERVGDRAFDPVIAAGRQFDDAVGAVVDDEQVIAEAAVHGVHPGAAVQRVVAVAAGQGIVAIKSAEAVGGGIAGHVVFKRVAGSADAAGAGQRQVFKGGPQRPGHRGAHQIGAFAGRLHQHIRGRVDREDVVSGAADHAVVAGAAGQQVIAAAADQGVVARHAVQCIVAVFRQRPASARISGDQVVQRVAPAVEVGTARQDQVFDVVDQRQGDRRLDKVDPGRCGLGQNGRGAGDKVGVVPGPAFKVVGAAAAGQGVVAGAAIETVVVRAAIQRIVAGGTGQHVGQPIAHQRVIEARAGQVFDVEQGIQIGLTGKADGLVKVDVHGGDGKTVVGGVDPGTTLHQVGPFAAGQHVVARIADQRVGMRRADGILEPGQDVGIGITAAGRHQRQVDGHRNTGPGIADRVGSGPAIQRVAQGAAGQRIVTVAAGQGVGSGIAGQRVVQARAEDVLEPGHHVARCIAHRPGAAAEADGDAGGRGGIAEQVGPGAAVQRVRPGPADDGIAADAAIQAVRGGVAGQRVVLARADDDLDGGEDVALRVAADPGSTADGDGDARR